jgi:hypothetical protein
LNPARPDYFPKLPYSDILPESAVQNARVGWRELIRVKKNNNVRIEDLGIAADKIFKPIQADLQPNTDSNSQYDRIAADLNRIAVTSGKKNLYFATNPAFVINGQLGDAASFDFDIRGLSRIEIIDENGSKKAELSVGASDLPKRQQRQIRFNPDIKEPTVVKYNIRAFDARGRQHMNTFRIVRFLPNSGDFLQIRADTVEKVAFGSAKYYAQFDAKNIREGKLGWNLVNGAYQVADGVQYQDNVESTLSYFVNSALPSFKVAVKASYETELDYDFIQIGYVRNGVTTQFLTSVNQETSAPQNGVSGKGVIDQTFTVTGTGTIEVFIRFISDAGVTDVGATIESITFSA